MAYGARIDAGTDQAAAQEVRRVLALQVPRTLPHNGVLATKDILNSGDRKLLLESMHPAAVNAADCSRPSAPQRGATIAMNESSSAAKEVSAARAERNSAMVAVNQAALNRLLADDITFIHTMNAVLDTKASLMKRLRTRALVYREITTEEEQVRVFGEVATVAGSVRVTVESQGRRLRCARASSRYGGGTRQDVWQQC